MLNSRKQRAIIPILVFGMMLSLFACSSNITPPYTAETASTQTSTPNIESQKPTITETVHTPSVTAIITETLASPSNTSTPDNLELENATTFPQAELFTWRIIAENFNQPVGLASPLDGSERLFVLEKEGVIRIIQDGKVLPDPFMDLRGLVRTSGAYTRGLLGMTFHPDYVDNGLFFLYYTNQKGNSVISRFQTSANPNMGDLLSELQLMEISFPVGEHIGGGLAFGPDGYLYASIGDGGGGGYGDKDGNAQNKDSLLGAILRLDVDHGQPYSIPKDNPYLTGGGKPEIWAKGLRNPWRFTFDRLAGDIFIADVGENQWEEINFLPPTAGGINFGWNYLEGNHPFSGNPPDLINLTSPIWEYDHSQGCSVIGGEVYRGKKLPEFSGIYVYADYCSGKIWGLLKNSNGDWENKLLFELQAYITSFGQDESGELYISDFSGRIYKLERK